MKLIKEMEESNTRLTDETFWREHINGLRKTKLSRKAYCREQHLNYARFQYWYRKLASPQRKKAQIKAIPVQVNTLPIEAKNISNLCTFEFGSGQQLRIHDDAVLQILLKRLF